jgi:hypothetical protein
MQQARRIIKAGIPFGPRLCPCVCLHGQHAHAGKQGTGRCSGIDDDGKHCGCGRYRAAPEWELAYAAFDAGNTSFGHALREYDAREREAHHNKNPRAEGTWSLGASDAGTCRRAIWYRNMPPVDLVRDPVDNREARIGAIIHEEAVRRLAKLYPWRRFEQPVKIRGLDREARYDWYDEITAEVEDLKTAGDWMWDQVDDFGPFEHVWKQVFLYGLALHEEGLPVETVRITYLKRCNGHDQTFVEDFDVELAKQYRNELLAVAQALDIVHAEMQRTLAEDPEAKYEPGELLPRDRSGPSTDPLCRRCPFRSHCWNLVQAEENGRSGESWIMLGPTPEEADIAWALQQNVDAKQLGTDAKKATEETKVWLEGLETGRYGDYQLVESQDYGSKPQYKKDSDNLRGMLAAGIVPDVESMPVPIGEPSRHLQAKRVPKSVLAKEARDKQKFLSAAADAAAADLATSEVPA